MEASYPIWMEKRPGIPRKHMVRVPLLSYREREELEASLEAGPQFARLNWREMLARRADQLRIVLIARRDYYAVQAAAHLAALERLYRPWPEEDEGEELKYMTVLDASLLCPGEKSLALSEPGAPAVLIRGDVLGEGYEWLTDWVEDTTLCATGHPTHIFLALHPEQVDSRQLADLQLRYSFQVGVVDEPDLPYLGRQLRQLTREILPVEEGIDWEGLAEQVRELRGEDFVETDLVCVPALALMNGPSIPASRQDLEPKLFDLTSLS